MKKIFRYTPIALIFLVIAIYLPGIGSAFYYDDYANLDGLRSIQNTQAFWHFVFNGHAGPLGRPLSLWTFAMQKDAWPSHGDVLFLINIFIHASNTLLIFYISSKLFSICQKFPEEYKNIEFGFLAATFWALSPILASSSLILIQRMTVLSAFFVFLTVLIYLHSFSFFQDNPKKQIIFQFFIVGFGTALAALSKENGVLIPSLIFCLEVTILKNYQKAQKLKKLRSFVFGLSLVVFIFYLSPFFREWFSINEYRQFSAWQRLQGEFIILWQYVKLIFLPKVAFFGPFQDQILLKNNYWIFAAAAWLGLLGVAIFFKERIPEISLGIFWFLVGHLLESSTILLEPYYEHRNYVPLFGVAIIFSSVAYRIIKINKLFRLAVYGYILTLASILFIITSLWGKPAEAADFWVETNLGSVRAVVHQVNIKLGKNQEDLERNQNKINSLKDVYGALSIIDRAIQNCRDCFELEIQSIVLSCLVESKDKTIYRLKQAEKSLKNYTKINITVVDGSANIGNLIANGQCDALSYNDLDELIGKILKQKSADVLSFVRPRLEYQRATLAYADGRFDDAENIAIQSEKKYPEVQPINDFLIDFYIDRGTPEVALDFMENKLKSEISNDMKKHLEEKISSMNK